jgi:hypothetical protein
MSPILFLFFFPVKFCVALCELLQLLHLTTILIIIIIIITILIFFFDDLLLRRSIHLESVWRSDDLVCEFRRAVRCSKNLESECEVKPRQHHRDSFVEWFWFDGVWCV